MATATSTVAAAECLATPSGTSGPTVAWAAAGTSEPAIAEIGSPGEDSALRGVVAVTGSVRAGDWVRFQVQCSQDGENWSSIDGMEHSSAVSDGLLAMWNTTTLSDGEAWLRLSLVGACGDHLTTDPVRVTLSNAE